MKHIFYILLILASSSYAYGQQLETQPKEERVKSIELRTGILQHMEGNLHNKVFNGLNYTFLYSNTLQKKNLSQFKFAIGNGFLQTSVGEGFSSTLVNIGLDYHYLFKVYRNDKWEIHSGLGSQLNYNIGYYWVWDESHLYWASFLSFNFSHRILYETHRNNRVILDFSLPLFLFLCRPETERNFKMDDFSFAGIMNSFHYKPEAKFLANSSFLNMSVEYQYQRKNKFQPFFTYSFNYFNLKTTYSNPAKSIQHLAGLKWNL